MLPEIYRFSLYKIDSRGSTVNGPLIPWQCTFSFLGAYPICNLGFVYKLRRQYEVRDRRVMYVYLARFRFFVLKKTLKAPGKD